MKKNIFLLLAFSAAVFTACNDDGDGGSNGGANAAAFPNPSINLAADVTTVIINFENAVAADGAVTLNVTPTNVVYGTDFSTMPAVDGSTIVVPFAAGAESASLTFSRLLPAVEGEVKNVVFTIASVSVNGVTIPEATKSVRLNFDEVPVETNSVSPAIGGANIPKAVYFDLSSGIETGVTRTGWDLAFYSGDEFQVGINASIKMAAKNTGLTDMTQVVAVDAEVAVGEGGGSGIVAGNPDYVDYPDGLITGTAIDAVSSTDSENKVYLVNLGHQVATEAPAPGSTNPYGASRGWKKIRVLRDGNNYKLQYADINSSAFSEISIAKDPNYNFAFFSFNTNSVVLAEPQKAKWDICFTPFVNLVNFGSGLVSYAYQDFIVTNRNGGARAYQQLNSSGVAYADFTLADVETANFDLATSIDQRVIGANWRNGGGPGTLPSVRDDRFYVIKDPSGNIYKVRFLSLTNPSGERGNPSFEYQLLN